LAFVVERSHSSLCVSSPPPVSCYFSCAALHRHLHSFPTRRSSDLSSTSQRARRSTASSSSRVAAHSWCAPRAAWRSWSRRKASTDRKSTRLNSSHGSISYAVFCLKKKKKQKASTHK